VIYVDRRRHCRSDLARPVVPPEQARKCALAQTARAPLAPLRTFFKHRRSEPAPVFSAISARASKKVACPRMLGIQAPVSSGYAAAPSTLVIPNPAAFWTAVRDLLLPSGVVLVGCHSQGLVPARLRRIGCPGVRAISPFVFAIQSAPCAGTQTWRATNK
jgi:hypothetical protein